MCKLWAVGAAGSNRTQNLRPEPSEKTTRRCYFQIWWDQTSRPQTDPQGRLYTRSEECGVFICCVFLQTRYQDPKVQRPFHEASFSFTQVNSWQLMENTGLLFSTASFHSNRTTQKNQILLYLMNSLPVNRLLWGLSFTGTFLVDLLNWCYLMSALARLALNALLICVLLLPVGH